MVMVIKQCDIYMVGSILRKKLEIGLFTCTSNLRMSRSDLYFLNLVRLVCGSVHGKLDQLFGRVRNILKKRSDFEVSLTTLLTHINVQHSLSVSVKASEVPRHRGQKY